MPTRLRFGFVTRGFPPELIADCLDIEPEAVDSLLRVAEAKLATAQSNII